MCAKKRKKSKIIKSSSLPLRKPEDKLLTDKPKLKKCLSVSVLFSFHNLPDDKLSFTIHDPFYWRLMQHTAQRFVEYREGKYMIVRVRANRRMGTTYYLLEQTTEKDMYKFLFLCKPSFRYKEGKMLMINKIKELTNKPLLYDI
jgi:hypothetical protein